MNIQIQQIDNDLFVDSRIIANGFGIEHESLVRSIKKQFSDLKSGKSESTGGRQQVFYHLPEEIVLIVPAICRPTKKTIEFQTELVHAFIAMRKEIQNVFPKDSSEQAVYFAKALLESIDKNKELETTVKELTPKAEFHDQVTASHDCITVNEMAKLLGTGQKRLFEWLRDNKILMSKTHRNQPYQSYLDIGYFDVQEVPLRNGRVYVQSVVTTKGQVWLSNKFN